MSRHSSGRGSVVWVLVALDIHGPPGESWTLGASMGTVSIRSPGWGTLGLDPGDLIVVEQGVLDPAGHHLASYGIGLAPASVSGILVYGQALVGSSPGLSNRETFAFTGL